MLGLDESRLMETIEVITYPEAHIGVTHPVYPGVHEAAYPDAVHPVNRDVMEIGKSLGEAIGGSNWIPFALGAGLVWVSMTTSGRGFLGSLAKMGG